MEGSRWNLGTKFHRSEMTAGACQRLHRVTNIEITQRLKFLPYQYFSPGPERSARYLTNLCKAGVYEWDLNQVKSE